ncbi:hypothetical protein ACTWJ9_33630 (plasmid) [Streptomyces sp. GDS52]|uniref:hypothetical protein n=1 Tax=Streptomyces sp. GDS52 TaxID=3406419 RepID=UPI003FD22B28
MTPNQPEYDPEFHNVIHGGYGIPAQPEFTDPTPYGIQTHSGAAPVKTGLTPRGKAALGVGTVAIACASLFGWQHYSAQQAANEVRAQEFAIQKQQLELEKLKELNKVNAAQQETQATENAARQKQIDACVADNKGLVGKQLGASYRSVVEDCQAQYPATSSTDMQAVATTADPTGGGVNPGLLLGAGVLGLGLAVAVKKSTKSHPA